MKIGHMLLLIILQTTSTSLLAQNTYQTQLVDLTTRLEAFEKDNLARHEYSQAFVRDSHALVKDFHRLGITAVEEAVNKSLDEELGDLILTTTDLAVLRLTFLEYYVHYKQALYKTNLDKVNVLFQSTFQRVKTVSKPH